MKRTGFILLILFIILAAGCDTGIHQRINCICLIDYSGSLSEQTLHRYIEIISSDVLGHLGEKDRLVVLPIDEGAKTQAVKLVFDDLADKKFSYSTDGYTHARDSLAMRLKLYTQQTGPVIAAELLRQKTAREKFTYYSDIFSALEQASSLMEQNDPDTFWAGVERFLTGKKRIVSTNVLILFSDMIQETAETTFAGPEGPTAEQSRTVLERLKSAGRIPNFQGCKVFVNGRTGKSNVQVDNIQNFWTQYFKDAGAQLSAYDYDAGPQIISFLTQRGAQAQAFQ